MTKLNPTKFSFLPFPYKAFQLLLEEYAAQRDSKMKQSKSVDESFEDYGSTDEFASFEGFCELILDYDSGNESDDSDIKESNLYSLDLLTEVVHSFGRIASRNIFNFNQYKNELSPRHQELLKEIEEQQA